MDQGLDQSVETWKGACARAMTPFSVFRAFGNVVLEDCNVLVSDRCLWFVRHGHRTRND